MFKFTQFQMTTAGFVDGACVSLVVAYLFGLLAVSALSLSLFVIFVNVVWWMVFLYSLKLEQKKIDEQFKSFEEGLHE